MKVRYQYPMTKKLPFLTEFVPLIRAGKKTMTARTRRYGEAGHVVNSPAGPLVLDEVCKVPLRAVANRWREEGCESREHFIEVWKRIHPGKGYQPEQMVWMHRFHRISDEACHERSAE